MQIARAIVVFPADPNVCKVSAALPDRLSVSLSHCLCVNLSLRIPIPLSESSLLHYQTPSRFLRQSICLSQCVSPAVYSSLPLPLRKVSAALPNTLSLCLSSSLSLYLTISPSLCQAVSPCPSPSPSPSLSHTHNAHLQARYGTFRDEAQLLVLLRRATMLCAHELSRRIRRKITQHRYPSRTQLIKPTDAMVSHKAAARGVLAKTVGTALHPPARFFIRPHTDRQRSTRCCKDWDFACYRLSMGVYRKAIHLMMRWV